MSIILYSYILVLYYAHHAINKILTYPKSTKIHKLRSLHCNNIVITKCSFTYHYYFHYAVIKMIKTKKNIFLVNNNINFAMTFSTPGPWKITYFYFVTTTTTTTTFTTAWFRQTKYYFDFHHFRFSTTSTSSATFTMSCSREFFLSFLCFVHYVIIKTKKIIWLLRSLRHDLEYKSIFFVFSLSSVRHD